MNRLLLAAYPESCRSRQGEELLACLTEAYPGRSWPPPREVAALVRAGAQARARAVVDDTARPWWLDGIRLAALALAALALVVVSPRVRPYAATAGVLWLACIAAASATMGGHRPSEVLGATLLACVCYGLATWLLPPTVAPGVTRSPRALPAITLTPALAIALASGARNDTLTRSLVSAATAFLCATLVWHAAVGRPAHPARRTLA